MCAFEQLWGHVVDRPGGFVKENAPESRKSKVSSGKASSSIASTAASTSDASAASASSTARPTARRLEKRSVWSERSDNTKIADPKSATALLVSRVKQHVLRLDV